MPDVIPCWHRRDPKLQEVAQRLDVPPGRLAEDVWRGVTAELAHRYLIRACGLAVAAVLTDTPDPALCQRARRAFRRAARLNPRLRRAALEAGHAVAPAPLR
jgi:hypothetical protein